MLLIGFKNLTTGTGTNENDYSLVTHQQTDIIAGSPTDTTESLTKLYGAMIQKAEKSRAEFIKLEDEMEWREVSNEEFAKIEKKQGKLREDLQILKYDKVIIVEGIILK